MLCQNGTRGDKKPTFSSRFWWIGFIRFMSRPCRDVGLSRHCEDLVLLYRVMQGRVPDGTLAHRRSPHGTAWTLSSCTVLCKVSSLSGRWSRGCLVTALRGLCPLVPCYARSRPCRDGLPFFIPTQRMFHVLPIPIQRGRHAVPLVWICNPDH